MSDETEVGVLSGVFICPDDHAHACTLVWGLAQYERLMDGIEGLDGPEQYAACWRYILRQLHVGIAAEDRGAYRGRHVEAVGPAAADLTHVASGTLCSVRHREACASAPRRHLRLARTRRSRPVGGCRLPRGPQGPPVTALAVWVAWIVTDLTRDLRAAMFPNFGGKNESPVNVWLDLTVRPGAYGLLRKLVAEHLATHPKSADGKAALEALDLAVETELAPGQPDWGRVEREIQRRGGLANFLFDLGGR